MQLVELSFLRQVAYRLFSSILLYPDEERLMTIATAAEKLQKQIHSMDMFIFSTQWYQLLATLTDIRNHHSLGEEYIHVFMHNKDVAPCLPYESVYLAPGEHAKGWVLAALEREYAAAGLAMSPSLKDLPDHVAVELEFMSFLCSQETDIWHKKLLDKGIQSLEQQSAFLNRHLVRWFPVWARTVETADDDGIYSTVVETARTFISHDKDLLDILLEKLRGIPETDSAVGTSKTVIEQYQCSRGKNHA